MTKTTLVLCQTADGWSLHPAGSTDEQIASGEAQSLASGPGEPDDGDHAEALRVQLAALVLIARASANLMQLRDRMNEVERLYDELLRFDPDADFENDLHSAGMNMADLPNFSDHHPDNTEGIWSWDEEEQLEVNDHVWTTTPRYDRKGEDE